MDFFWVANKKARKAIDKVRVILNKIHLSLFTVSLRCLFPHFFPVIDHFAASGSAVNFDNVMTKFIINKRTDA